MDIFIRIQSSHLKSIVIEKIISLLKNSKLPGHSQLSALFEPTIVLDKRATTTQRFRPRKINLRGQKSLKFPEFFESLDNNCVFC